MTGRHDPRLAGLAAALCALIAIVVPLEPIRILAAIPLALFLPGYAIVAAVFGGRLLDVPQRLLLAVASSLAIAALGGIVLNVLPGGIDTLNWALLLVAITAVGGIVAERRRRSGLQRRPAPGQPLRANRRELAMLAAAAMIAAVAIAVAQIPFPADRAEGFTALAMLPREAGERVEIEVISSEQETQRYVLRVASDGASPTTRRFTLDPGEQLSLEVQVEADAARARRVEASLFRAESPERLYREVSAWVGGDETRP